MSHFLIITFVFFSCFALTSQQILVSPITKDESTNLYTMLVYLKTPLQPSNLHLDLGSYLSWYDCARHYQSSSYKPVYSNSSLCTDLNPGIFSNCFNKPGPGCFNDSCSFFPENPVTRKIGIGELLVDKFALPTKKLGQLGPVSDFLFSCTDPNKYSRIYRGLAKGVKGLAALGRFNYSLPAQLSRTFSSPQIFAVCLPGSSKANGVALFNSPGPYYFSPGIDLSKSLIYTPLLQGPRGADTQIYYWYKSPDYYIGLTSIKVNGKVVPLNKTLLAIDELGSGGTKISTSRPYMVLQSSIFKALSDAFVRESTALNLTLINPVEPFHACYAAQGITNTRISSTVPIIDFVLQENNVFWRIFGSNSMVRITTNDVDAWCLGIIDGGPSPKTSIVIGGHQIEDNLLQFDLQLERLGFSSSLLLRSTSCSNFDFNSTKN
ncbi:Eukaryotic aspartyl protease family protein [Forsythia ovata]|uniref:Eukaryotic aspartyl protease family protein n=1 Tax=Forsythia ovata TaxID=205694 RepID=A0ABD1VDE5_9LAMI